MKRSHIVIAALTIVLSQAAQPAQAYLKAYGTVVTGADWFDLSVQGVGNFHLNGSQGDLLVPQISADVAANLYLQDQNTAGYLQRWGTTGESMGFQQPGNMNIRIPYDMTLMKATTTIIYQGNLSADAAGNPTTHILASQTHYNSGIGFAQPDTLLSSLQETQGMAVGDRIRIQGTTRDGTNVDLDMYISPATTTMGNLCEAISAAFTGSSATLFNGEIRLADDLAGYSLTDLHLSYDGAGSFDLPSYFRILTAGGRHAANTNLSIYDPQGIAHALSVTFVQQNETNLWDAVLTDLTGDVELLDRRVNGISFLSSGAFNGWAEGSSLPPTFELRGLDGTGSITSLELDLGEPGQFNGVTQFGGQTTVAPVGQDGYRAGHLSDMYVTGDAILMGELDNGQTVPLAEIALVVIPEPASLGLIAMGGLALLRRRRKK